MAWELLVGYVGSMFPDQGLNPGPSNWEHKVLAPGEGNGTPLQYSCLENPMDGGGWWAAVHGVAKSRARRGKFGFYLNSFILDCLGSGLIRYTRVCILGPIVILAV